MHLELALEYRGSCLARQATHMVWTDGQMYGRKRVTAKLDRVLRVLQIDIGRMVEPVEGDPSRIYWVDTEQYLAL